MLGRDSVTSTLNSSLQTRGTCYTCLDDFKPFLGHFLGCFWMSIYGDQFSGQLVLHDAQSRAANAGGEHIRGRKRKGLKSEEKGSPHFDR